MRQFWAEELSQRLGEESPLTLLRDAQQAAQDAGHHFYPVEGDDAYISSFEGEAAELAEALREGHSKAEIRNEIGDVIFNLINICRLQKIDMNEALDKVQERWFARKLIQERLIREAGYTWRDCPTDVKERIWQDVKRELKQTENKE